MSQEKVFDLDDVILSFRKDSPKDDFTLRQAAQGIQIFGAIGSGKTSGSGAFIAKNYLKAGFGGIVLTGKVSERDTWAEYARQANREDEMVYFSEESGFEFNPLAYEMSRTDSGGKRTETMTEMFMALTRLGSRISGGGGGGSDDPFWDLSLERLTKATLDILKISKEKITIDNMVRIIRSVPDGAGLIFKYEAYSTREQLIELDQEPSGKKLKYQEAFDNSYLIQLLYQLDKQKLSIQDKRAYAVAKEYFLIDYPNIPDKTKGSIVEMFFAFSNAFRSGLLAEIFAQGISDEIMPENTFEGKVIVINFPVKEYGKIGLFAQAIYKNIWQQAVERRTVNKNTVPVFFFCDEAQYFLDEQTMLFQTTARSARACSVFLTQNISNYRATISKSHSFVDSLLGNLVTKIFHANNDHVMNEWAAQTISKSKEKSGKGDMVDPDKMEITEDLKYQVIPKDFTELKTGGQGKIVQAYITSVGREWSSGTNYIKAGFIQSAEE